MREGRFAAALAAAQSAVRRDKDSLAAVGLAAFAALQVGQLDTAERLLRRQLELAPGDQAARGNLATLLASTNREQEALDIARHHDGTHRLARLSGFLHQQSGELGRAEADYVAAVAAESRDFESWNNLGNVRAALGNNSGAATAYETAINLGLSTPEVFRALCNVLRAFEHRSNRLAAASEGHRRFPGDRDLHIEFALATASSGEPEAALKELFLLLETEDVFGAAHVEYGLLLENLNRLDDLDAFVARCEEQSKTGGEFSFIKAWGLRRRNRFDEAWVEARHIAHTINPIRAEQLRADIAAGRGDADTAFDAYKAMNEAALSAFPAPAGPTFREKVEESISTVGLAARMPAVESDPALPPDPVFIVGFPRSGTTLLDTLLMALPELQVLEEQPMLSLVRNAYPSLGLLNQPGPARDAYWKLARQFGAVDGRWLVDKNPLHMAHAAEIYRLFPSASIVLVERHPCDVVLSCFMANFVLNHAMRSFTSIEEAALTYDAVFTAWEAARTALPFRVHAVRYERMIEDLEREMRPLVGFLGLPWRDSVLDNQTSAALRGHVRTASYAQVGQPI